MEAIGDRDSSLVDDVIEKMNRDFAWWIIGDIVLVGGAVVWIVFWKKKK